MLIIFMISFCASPLLAQVNYWEQGNSPVPASSRTTVGDVLNYQRTVSVPNTSGVKKTSFPENSASISTIPDSVSRTGAASTGNSAVIPTAYYQNVSSGVSQASYQENVGTAAYSRGTAVRPVSHGENAVSRDRNAMLTDKSPSQRTSSAGNVYENAGKPRDLQPVEMAFRGENMSQKGFVVPEERTFPGMLSAEDGLLAFREMVTTSAGNFQQITIIDPKQRSLCVYHININTGQIELRSARDIKWDLQLNYLNSKKPLPHEIKGILQGAKK
ncbi:MAG: hypothetical protein Q4C96_01085 [Planctomycetia bacterium]|nr:hypothetical protein [Planctomycetia bacterium]